MNIILVILNHTIFLSKDKEDILISKFFLKKVDLFNKLFFKKESNVINEYNLIPVKDKKNMYKTKFISVEDFLTKLINNELVLFTVFLNYYKNLTVNLEEKYLSMLRNDLKEHTYKFNKDLDFEYILDVLHNTKLTYKEE